MIKKILKIIGIGFGSLILLAIILPTPDEPVVVDVEIQEQDVIEEPVDEEVEPVVLEEDPPEESIVETPPPVVTTTSPKPKPQIETTPIIEQSKKYTVVSIVDGDTVKLKIDGQTETIRLIGIDTPETVHPSKPVECFGIEASNKAKELLSGKTVSLETDPTQGIRDKYGRLLGYIILPDGTNFNKLMLEEGYAYEYTYSTAYKYQSEFKAAETYARTNGIGLWGEGVCDEPVQTTEASPTGSKWYVSSHWSSKFYYCEESNQWEQLSPTYLRTYDSEDELKKDFPTHTLHESCL